MLKFKQKSESVRFSCIPIYDLFVYGGFLYIKTASYYSSKNAAIIDAIAEASPHRGGETFCADTPVVPVKIESVVVNVI